MNLNPVDVSSCTPTALVTLWKPDPAALAGSAANVPPPLVLRSGTEVLPGYTLVEELGNGSSGVVWKATSPGRLYKAIKFIHGSLRSIHGANLQAEMRALERIIAVRHPFVLSLERFDIVDDHLVIVTELADGSLLERFHTCQAQGLPGIPRDELLGYLAEAAEALDHLGTVYQLQHLDIKPQNLLLVCNHVKIGDFGLVQNLKTTHAPLSLRATPAYAPPEIHEGQLTPFCDQYSLAITYVELLTGQRPFQSNSRWQLLLQHAQQPPNLEALPPGDRSAVARALAKVPTERFASCQEFVAALGPGSRLRHGKAQPLPLGGQSTDWGAGAIQAASHPSPVSKSPAAVSETPLPDVRRIPGHETPRSSPSLDRGLLDELRNPDVQVCRRALLTLRRLGPEAQAAVVVCGNLLSHPDPTIRWETLQVVEQLGEEARPTQASLTSALNDPKDFIRIKAAEVLWRLDRRLTRLVLAQLIAVVAEVQSEALFALQVLARMGPAAQPAVPAILEALGTQLRGVARRQAIWTLNTIGLTADAVPVLEGLLEDADLQVAAEARAALERTYEGMQLVSPDSGAIS